MPTYRGVFEAIERAYLDTCFGGCHIDLVARSTHEPRLALIHWQVRRATQSSGQPLSTAPTAAYYVVDRTGPGEPQLDRIDDTRQLAARYPGHFPAVYIRRPWTQRLWERLQSPTRGMIVVAVIAWVIVVVLVLRLGL